jgi:hypothetical protein
MITGRINQNGSAPSQKEQKQIKTSKTKEKQ